MNASRGIKIFSYIVLAAFILSIIPLIAISFYNAPSADDFSFSQTTADAWRETNSLAQVIKAGLEKTGQIYETWQGSFAGVFLMTLQPAIFGEGAYFISTILTLGGLIFGCMLFFYVVLVKWFKLDKHLYMIIGLILTAVCIQFVPSPAQAFYWYNGSMYYTLFYAFLLTAVSLLLMSEFCVKKAVRIICGILAALLFFIVGGGNYVTVLIALLINALITAAAFFKKKRMRWNALICLLLCGAAFIISAVCPGNAIRQQALGQSASPVTVILLSLYEALKMFGEWTTAPMLLLFILITPFLYLAASKTNLSFKYPLLWIGAAYCLFAANFTPTLYVLQEQGAGRILNVNFYSYVFFAAFTIFCCSGWLHRKIQSSGEIAQNINGIKEMLQPLKKYAVCLLIVFALIFGLTVFGQKGLNSIASYSAARSIITGEAAQYKAEQDERLEILRNPEIDEAILNPFSVKPRVLFFDDITANPDNWKNTAVARYYNKSKVVLEP